MNKDNEHKSKTLLQQTLSSNTIDSTARLFLQFLINF
jgi:hypothetical protein